jgi:RNA polymerase sigma-70 factor (ECF subfamily)
MLIDTPDDRPEPDLRAESMDVYDITRQEIELLPTMYRTAITLYHLDELSYAEIGKAMSLPEGTVKSHIFRARKLLRDRLLAKYKIEDLWN